ncbi:pyroglutamyl-peptidase I [Neobacillus kokaensis]|uniref:Pyrrolidone-carboxylate peptidase n=1 Tax=Neobacillus kokaensis TaxID=2759023 RepID=A0ABQ3N5H7_9BACI|nr:pyroglutamyl-peptidase I [Neobacillus kokaensis]GHH98748.1 pyrrolidone-carboxylate peptidase [Neobacillus kokaensis]
MKTLLLTGFEPFLEFPINPTEKIVKELDGTQIGGYQIIGQLLPVTYEEAGERVLAAIQQTEPDAVISLGLAAGRAQITPERIAINCRDAAGAPDNNGVVLEDAPIMEDGPDGYFSTLPIRKFVNVLNDKGYPAKISNTAGTYLCNNIMYVVQHELREKAIPAGFVHIPASHELAVKGKKDIPSWSQQDLLEAVKIIISGLD